MPQGRNTIKWITKSDVPNNKPPTYGQLLCDIRMKKEETHRTLLTVGGDRIDYTDGKSTPTSDLTTEKFLIGSTLSTPNSKCLVAYINFLYLNTKMDQFEYMSLKIEIIPKEIIEQYNLKDKEYEGWIYIEIQMGVYGLP